MEYQQTEKAIGRDHTLAILQDQKKTSGKIQLQSDITAHRNKEKTFPTQTVIGTLTIYKWTQNHAKKRATVFLTRLSSPTYYYCKVTVKYRGYQFC